MEDYKGYFISGSAVPTYMTGRKSKSLGIVLQVGALGFPAWNIWYSISADRQRRPMKRRGLEMWSSANRFTDYQVSRHLTCRLSHGEVHVQPIVDLVEDGPAAPVSPRSNIMSCLTRAKKFSDNSRTVPRKWDLNVGECQFNPGIAACFSAIT
jgi:hypothetical protein